MVKNSGQKSRAKQYAAEQGITYQQARETLDSDHKRDEITALLDECGDLSGPLSRIPLGPDASGRMQWTPFPGPVTEIAGGPGSGKTTAVNRIIAYLATVDPREQSIVLFAGDREISQARKRWADWPQVIVFGPVPRNGRDRVWTVNRQPDRTQVVVPTPKGVPDEMEHVHGDAFKEHPIMTLEGAQTIIYDDWLTASDGSLPLAPSGEETPTADSKMSIAGLGRSSWHKQIKPTGLPSPVVAAFRPGHTSLTDERADIENAVATDGTFVPEDLFAPRWMYDSETEAIAETSVFALDDQAQEWAETRKLRASMTGDAAFEARAAINATIVQNARAEYDLVGRERGRSASQHDDPPWPITHPQGPKA